ncbi:MAG: hypothetical protein ACTSUE_01565, partial [Promethearchaeota archaeon]
MITIEDKELYESYRNSLESSSRTRRFYQELVLPALFLGSLGAITYAIRGSSGWGGFDGAIIPGMTAGISWYYLMKRRGVNARALIFWLGLANAIGGMWGYGQYASWIQGIYDPGYLNLPINPFQGYLWFFICGIGLGGPSGIVIGWIAAKKRVTLKKWLLRIFLPVGFVALGYMLVQAFPIIFFPHYEVYTNPGCHGCERTIFTNTTNFMVSMWWVGALVVAIIQKDRRTLTCGLILGIGYGFAQAIGGALMNGYEFAPGFIDWWKAWELTTGMIGGISYSIALYWIQRDVNKIYLPSGNRVENLDDKRNEAELRRIMERQRKFAEFFSWTAIITLIIVAYYGVTLSIGHFLAFYDIT